MEFTIRRTSHWGKKKPTAKAYEGNDIWYIEIKDLDALMSLVGEEGDIIVSDTTWGSEGMPSLEIYDNYRE